MSDASIIRSASFKLESVYQSDGCVKRFRPKSSFTFVLLMYALADKRQHVIHRFASNNLFNPVKPLKTGAYKNQEISGW